MRPIRTIVVHCSASPHGKGITAENIHSWHRERGFDGIGYHKVILENGVVQDGRPDYWQGAHAKGHNRGSIGICLMGMGGDATEAQLTSLAALIKSYEQKHGDLDVIGHNQVSDKICPGFNVPKWWKGVK